MDRRRIMLGVLGAAGIIVLAYLAGTSLPPATSCTALGCPCAEDGERPCNSCDVTDPLLVTGIVNVVQHCDAREILTCRDGEAVAERVEQGYCTVDITYLGLPG